MDRFLRPVGSDGRTLRERVAGRAGTAGSRAISYGLTAEGGRRWEIAAQADWSRFIYAWATVEEGGRWRWDLICADEARTRKSLEFWRSCPPPHTTVRIDEEIWDVREPFEATYWKTLHRGYGVRFLESKDDNVNRSCCASSRREHDEWAAKHERFWRWKRNLVP